MNVDKDAIELMRARAREGCTWEAYENKDLSSRNCGHLKFLHVGESCTFTSAPKTLPDGPDGAINWRYQHVGTVNLETGEIAPLDKR
jgi:hypothetical protein